VVVTEEPVVMDEEPVAPAKPTMKIKRKRKLRLKKDT